MAHVPKIHVESKYVSVFADAKPDVDITFRDDLLAAPAENYMVGIDHLMVNLGAFSMVPVHKNPIILEVLRLHTSNNANTYTAFPGGFRVTKDDGSVYDPATVADANKLRAYRIESTDGVNTFGQFMESLGQLAHNVNYDMSKIVVQPQHTTIAQGNGYGAAVQDDVNYHLAFELARNGNLNIHGSKAFWSNYMIHVPEEYFQQVFFGTSQELIIMTPAGVQMQTNDDNEVVERNVANVGQRRTVHDPFMALFTFHDSAHVGADANPNSLEVLTFKCSTCLFTTLDRRISIDVGTSLPIKGSPLVDKERDSHDFILARYMIKRPGFRFRGRTNTNKYKSGRDDIEFEEEPPGLQVYEDNKTQYHQLQPQQKISQLRIKLFARVRQYTDGAWEQQVIEVPTAATDYWFARIHFVGKG